MTALRPLNPTFSEAATGIDAIEKLTLHHHDAITLDLNMPDMHGLDFLNFVRDQLSLKNIPILVITTRNDTGSLEASFNAGATGYLTKPFEPQELLEAVERLLKPLSEK